MFSVDRHVRPQRVALEDHRHLALLGRQRARLRGHQPVADMDLAVGGFEETGDQPQRRGLAAAGRAEQADQLPVVDPQRDVIDDRKRCQIAWSGRANQRTPIASLPLLFVHGSAPGLVCQYTDKCGLGKAVELETTGRLVEPANAGDVGRVSTCRPCERGAIAAADAKGKPETASVSNPQRALATQSRQPAALRRGITRMGPAFAGTSH